MWIPGGNDRPYKCPVAFPTERAVKAEKAYYIRKMSNSIRAKQIEEKELFMLANNQPYDDRPNPAAKIEDLKSSLISEFLYAVKSDLYERSLSQPVAETAASMSLIGGPLEWRKPLNVGLMFFNERPEDFFPYARIEVVDKPAPTGIGMTEKIFTGPLNRQLRDALSYIKNYIIKEKVIKISNQAEAVRIFNLPYAAVEESLSNAVYHKSYQIGEPITVTVTPERMEITSLPGPDRTISNEDLMNRRLVSRRYRNRRIGVFLKELKELIVITLAESGNISTSGLASKLGYTKVTSTLSKALKELMAEGIIQYSEPEKVRSRNQKPQLAKEQRKKE